MIKHIGMLFPREVNFVGTSSQNSACRFFGASKFTVTSEIFSFFLCVCWFTGDDPANEETPIALG